MGFLDVSAGQVIASAHMDLAISQGLMRFTNAAQRDSQIPAPTVGMFCYLQDVNYVQVYDPPVEGGSATWRTFGTLRMGIANMGVGQAIANNTHQPLTFSSATGAANRPGRATWSGSEITVPLTGVYMFTADICWPDNANGERRLYVQSDRGGSWAYMYIAGGVAELNKATVGTTLLRQAITGVAHCYAGGKLRFLAYQSSGVTLGLPSSGTDVGAAHLQFLGAD